MRMRMIAVAGLVAVEGCASARAPAAEEPEALPPEVASMQPEPAAKGTEAKVSQSVVLTKGVRTLVVEGIEVTFLGNSHKMMEEGDSPLGVSLIVHRDGQDVEAHEWLELSEPSRFTAAGVDFEYVAHDYDRTLEVRVKTVDPFWGRQ